MWIDAAGYANCPGWAAANSAAMSWSRAAIAGGNQTTLVTMSAGAAGSA